MIEGRAFSPVFSQTKDSGLMRPPASTLEIGGRGRQETEIPQNKYSLVIIDFHGTITDHQLRTIRAYHHSAHAALGVHLEKDFYHAALTRPAQHAAGAEKSRRGDTASTAQTNRQFIQDQFGQSHGNQAAQAMYDEFGRLMNEIYIPIPGALRTMRQLREEGVEFAILTNGDNREVIQRQLEKWRLPDLAANLYSHHLSGFKKPDVKAVNYILTDYERKGKTFTPEQILLVGDYVEDVQAAHNMGMDSVLVIRGPGWERVKIREPRPTYVVTEVSDLAPILHGTYPPLSGTEVYIPPVYWKNEDWDPKNGEPRSKQMPLHTY